MSAEFGRVTNAWGNTLLLLRILPIFRGYTTPALWYHGPLNSSMRSGVSMAVILT